MSTGSWTVVYYETADGYGIVEEEMKGFGPKVFARILRNVDLLEEFGLELSQDYVEQVRGKIWELRASRYRVLYFAFHNRQFVLLRAFMKKTRKTPEREIKMAERRLADYTERYSTDR